MVPDDPAPPALAQDDPHPSLAEATEPVGHDVAGPAGDAKRTSAPHHTERLPAWARYTFPVAILAALVWPAGMAAFAMGYKNRFGAFEYLPFPVALFAALALLPAVFMLLAAYALRQGARLGMETRRARELAADLAVPAALAADQAGGAAEAVRREIERVSEAANAVETRLLGLRDTLGAETDRLVAATEAARRSSETMTAALGREREAMDGLSRDLSTQTEAMAEAVGEQARFVADISDLATTQLRESEAALTARAADLTAAAGAVAEAAQDAVTALAAETDRMDVTGAAAAGRLVGLNATLTAEDARLSALLEKLHGDHEGLSELLGRHVDVLAAAADTARDRAGSMLDAADHSAEGLNALIAQATAQMSALVETATAEQAELDARARAGLALFTGAVAEERAAIEAQTRAAVDALAASAEEARAAAARHADSARQSVEQLGEAAFAVGRSADQAFDARVGVARRMIEQSAALVEEAGRRSAEKIEAGVAAATAAMQGLDTLMNEIDAKVAGLPKDAQDRAEAVRTAVEGGMADLGAAARRVAEETQAIDAAFQARVRHNYQTLSEALQLVSKIADASPTGAPPKAETGARAAAPSAKVVVAKSADDPTIRVAASILVPVLERSKPNGKGEDLPNADDAGLRPRLRLTTPPVAQPAAKEEASKAQDDSGEWTWKDLLSAIDEPPIDDEVLAEKLMSELQRLGLDSQVLLPAARIDEIAVQMQAGEGSRVRSTVRSLAPTAVRRLSRRVSTDTVLRAHAARYVRRYEDLLTDSAKRDEAGLVTAALLGSEPGRTYLLFDAAVREAR